MSLVREKSYAFAVRIVKLSQHLQSSKKEFVMAKQILRSGTAIGALLHEAKFGESKPDFIHKMSIALKKANETLFWLSLLNDTNYITQKQFQSIGDDCNELISLLVKSIKTSKSR